MSARRRARRPGLPERWGERLQRCLVRDARDLERRAAAGRPRRELASALERAERRAAERVSALPRPRPNSALPIHEYRAELVAAIAGHQVTVVCGATGSGKSTQLPQLALLAGRGRRGYIGHTQPRRIAASAVAQRVAAELGSAVGAAVGYKVRFRDRVAPTSAIKLMTDGILLAEIHSDPDLLAYDTLILDETHERSLNIDFLLGYLRGLLPRRPDLHLLVTSATIDPEGYAAFFAGAAVLDIPGRSHPVEVRYRPPAAADTLEEACADAALSLITEAAGDVLVFLPGEREIARTATVLKRRARERVEILPLYARLPRREQERIFAPSGACSRVVLATNVAETSLTVPGIRYVVDSGLARIARYSPHAAVQRLPVEPISQASADQRKGRAGRTAPGVCVRLYEESDLAARPRFTEPEIRRSGLAGVLLRMAALDLGRAEEFPFLDRPAPKSVRAGYRVLAMLGATERDGRLTQLGVRLARLPLDPRLARVLVEAVRRDVLAQGLTIVAALAVPDPRERPAGAAGAARTAHAEFCTGNSDFLSDLALWEWYRDVRARCSRRASEQELRRRFLSPGKLREWEAVRGELARMLAAEGVRETRGRGSAAELHRAVLAGFLDRVAVRAEPGTPGAGTYLTARGHRVDLSPASALFGRDPRFIVAAELVETSRVFAHRAAAVVPAWIEELGAHLVRRRAYAPHWDEAAGRVLAREDTTLYGLTLASGRTVDFAGHDRAAAREIFIRDALVGGALATRSRGVARNRQRRRELESAEERARRRDLLAAPERLEAFYCAQLPADVCDAPGFERWAERAERDEPGVLEAGEAVLALGSEPPRATDFPDELALGPIRTVLRYRFQPGDERDGLTIAVPIAGLDQIDAERAEWLVPGLLEEKLEALIRTLPKPIRRRLVPAAGVARDVARRLEFAAGSLRERAARELERRAGIPVRAADFGSDRLPPHLRLRFELLDSSGNVVAAGRDLDALRERHESGRRAAFAELAETGFEGREVQDWDFGDLPRERTVDPRSGVRGYPALVAEGERILLRTLGSRAAARQAHVGGLVALLRRQASKQLRELRRSLDLPPAGDLARFALTRDFLLDDLVAAALADCIGAGDPPRSGNQYSALRERAVRELIPRTRELAVSASAALAAAAQLDARLADGPPRAWNDSVAEMRAQLQTLFFPGFVRATPEEYRPRLPAYVAALEKRLERLGQDPARDLARRRALAPLVRALERLESEVRAGACPLELRRARFALEELRIQTFAQEIGTREKISPARVARLFDELARPPRRG